MADIETEIATLRANVAQQGRELAQAEQQVSIHRDRQGAALGDLKAEFDVDDIDAAKAKAVRVEAALRTAAAKARQALAQAGGQA